MEPRTLFSFFFHSVVIVSFCQEYDMLWRAISENIIFGGNVKKCVGLHEVCVG